MFTNKHCTLFLKDLGMESLGAEWTAYMAMQKLLNQARSLSNSISSPILPPHTNDVIPTPKHSTIPESIQCKPTTSCISQQFQKNNLSSHNSNLDVTKGLASVTTETSYRSASELTSVSSIPSPLQQFIQHPPQPASPYSPPSSSPHLSSRSSSPNVGHTTAAHPPPLSISPTLSLSRKHFNDQGPTPLTPLSPYNSQQGKIVITVVTLFSKGQ